MKYVFYIFWNLMAWVGVGHTLGMLTVFAMSRFK